MAEPVGEKEQLPEEEKKPEAVPPVPAAPVSASEAELWMGEAGQNGGMMPSITARPSVVRQLPDLPGLPEKVAPVTPYPLGTPEIRPPRPPYDERAAAEEQRRREKMSKASYDRAVASARAAGIMALDNTRARLIETIIDKFGEYGFPLTVATVHERFEHFYTNYQNLLAKEAADRQTKEDNAYLQAIDEDARFYGLPPQVLAADSELVRKREADAKRALDEHLNDQRQAELTSAERTENHSERQNQTRKVGKSLDHLATVHKFRREISEISAKILRGENLEPGEYEKWENRHKNEQAFASIAHKALTDLTTAKAILARLLHSTALRKLDRAKTVGEFLSVLNDNMEEIVRLGTSEVLSDLVVQGVGSFFGGPLGAILASSVVAFGSAFPAAIVEAFEKRGIDLDDHDAILAVTSSKQKMDEIYEEARKSAGIDALAAGLGVGVGKVPLGMVRQRVGKIVTSASGSIVQGSISAGGEIVKHHAIGNEESLTGGMIGHRFFQGIISDQAAKAVSGLAGTATGPARSGGSPTGPRQADGKASTPMRPGDGATTAPQAGAGRGESVVRIQKQQSSGRNQKENEAGDGNLRIAKSDDVASQAKSAAQALAQAMGITALDGDATQALRSHGVPEVFYLTWVAADRLRKAGILTDNVMAKLGIQKKWLESTNPTSDVMIQGTVLLAAGLTQFQTNAMAMNVRMTPNAMSAYEADTYLSERNARLAGISDFFKKAGETRPDGWATYKYVYDAAIRKNFTLEQAHRKAAEVTEYFANRAIAAGNMTIDFVFDREYDPKEFGLK